jgi:hypothetical protein
LRAAWSDEKEVEAPGRRSAGPGAGSRVLLAQFRDVLAQVLDRYLLHFKKPRAFRFSISNQIAIFASKREAFAIIEADEIRIPPIRSTISYATAMHELGHQLGNPRHQNSSSVMARERDAWRWARSNAKIWTPAMERQAVKSLQDCASRSPWPSVEPGSESPQPTRSGAAGKTKLK